MIRSVKFLSLLAVALLAPIVAIGVAENEAYARNCCKQPKCNKCKKSKCDGSCGSCGCATPAPQCCNPSTCCRVAPVCCSPNPCCNSCAPTCGNSMSSATFGNSSPAPTPPVTTLADSNATTPPPPAPAPIAEKPVAKPAPATPPVAPPKPAPAPAKPAPVVAPPAAKPAPAPAPQAAVEPGFQSLFNGKDLTGWEGLPGYWTVEDGAITGRTFADAARKLTHNTFLVWKGGDVDNFELKFSFKMVGGNSGVQYRSKQLKDPKRYIVGGYQADIDSGDKYSALLYEEQGRGILAERGTKVTLDENDKKKNDRMKIEKISDPVALQKLIKKEQWNEYTVIAEGNHLQHYINGVKMTEFFDNQVGARAMKGILALQIHVGPPMVVQFKNIRLKRLKLTAGMKKVVLIAGRQSHGIGEHEFNAGCTVLQKCLDQVPGIITAKYTQGWPTDPTAFDNADALVFFMDGGKNHPIIQADRLITLHKLMQQGMGLSCLHYAVEVPQERGGPELLDWIGGYFEMNWSINPHWTAKFTKFPVHPATRGVQPFEINDEWYYHMRFRNHMEGVTPILTDIPPASTVGKDGTHSGNPAVRAEIGKPQHVAWVSERAGGGRGFGFTGGHLHKNWSNDNFRKVVLNSIVWTAHGEVPPAGIQSSVTAADLEVNLDPKVRKKAPESVKAGKK